MKSLIILPLLSLMALATTGCTHRIVHAGYFPPHHTLYVETAPTRHYVHPLQPEVHYHAHPKAKKHPTTRYITKYPHHVHQTDRVIHTKNRKNGYLRKDRRADEKEKRYQRKRGDEDREFCRR